MSVGDVGVRATLQGFASPTCRKMSSKRSSITLSLPSSTSAVLTKNFLHLSRASVMIPQESLHGRLVMVINTGYPLFTHSFLAHSFYFYFLLLLTRSRQDSRGCVEDIFRVSSFLGSSTNMDK